MCVRQRGSLYLCVRALRSASHLARRCSLQMPTWLARVAMPQGAPVAMTTGEVDELPARFAFAASVAKETGFTGEHAACVRGATRGATALPRAL
jgi:hypothetical protein